MSALEEATETALRLDAVFSAERPDWAEVCRSSAFPLTLQSHTEERVFDDPDAFQAVLERLWHLARADGVVGMNSHILSRVEIAPGVVLVATKRDRVSCHNGVISSAQVTYTMVKEPDGWKIKRTFFYGSSYLFD